MFTAPNILDAPKLANNANVAYIVLLFYKLTPVYPGNGKEKNYLQVESATWARVHNVMELCN